MSMDPAGLLGHLRTAVASFEAVLVDGDLDAPVPACPGWDLRRLAWHLGGVHRWARFAIVERRAAEEDESGPADPEPLRQWYSEGAGQLLATLEQTAPEAPVWSFGPKPSTAAFWFRRQAHETTVHARDAQASQRGAVARIDPALAVDGIDEVVRMFFPRQVRLGRIPALARSLALVPDDGSGWVLAGDGTAPVAVADAEAAVRGPAQALLLLLWHRLDLESPELHLDGDPSAAHAVLASSLTP